MYPSACLGPTTARCVKWYRCVLGHQAPACTPGTCIRGSWLSEAHAHCTDSPLSGPPAYARSNACGHGVCYGLCIRQGLWEPPAGAGKFGPCHMVNSLFPTRLPGPRGICAASSALGNRVCLCARMRLTEPVRRCRRRWWMWRTCLTCWPPIPMSRINLGRGRWRSLEVGPSVGAQGGWGPCVRCMLQRPAHARAHAAHNGIWIAMDRPVRYGATHTICPPIGLFCASAHLVFVCACAADL